MSALVLGNGLDATTTLGPLVSSAQQKRVAELVKRAIADGATAICGGTATAAPMHGYAATVLTGVKQDHYIVQQEVFWSRCTNHRSIKH